MSNTSYKEAIDLLKCDTLALPKRWDTFGSNDLIQFMNDKLYAEFKVRIRSLAGSDPVTATIKSNSSAALALCDTIQEIVQKQFVGNYALSAGLLFSAIESVQTFFDTLISGDIVGDKANKFFRIRVNDFPAALTKRDLFHVPFELRHKVSHQRYSFPGVPCLYLGGSIYDCWVEMDEPLLDKIAVSEFRIAPSQSIKVLDFGFIPAYLGDYLSEVEKGTVIPTHIDMAVAYVVCWPLISACSIKTRWPEGDFKPEYLLPQLLLNWVMISHDLGYGKGVDGILYFTTTMDDYTNADVRFYFNLVLPVQTSLDKGFCPTLSSKCHLTNPVPWSLAESIYPDRFMPLDKRGLFTLKSGRQIPYWNSKFGQIEGHLSKERASPVD